ncbi:MAG: protein kinase [Deltaproteobacteria bacterium]|nr:protein kinase [Deltaproteobacteria bacterium]
MSLDPKRERASPGAEEVHPPLPPVRRLSIGAIGHGWGEWHYRLLAPIARGGMGEIYIAERANPRSVVERVVVKRLLESLREDESYIEMFKAEAAHLARLDHPNIVKILDVPVVNETRCLALEYVHGRSVAQMLDSARHLGERIPPEVCVYITGQVLAGLDHVHQARLEDGRSLDLVHRDVTPGNILVSFQGEVKLTDFGIAKSLMSGVSTTVGIVKGKARYLAPEQILGERASPRSDIFSCGLVLYEMLTSEPLFERPTVPKTLAAIVHGEMPDLPQVIPARSAKLLTIIGRALSAQPENRYAGAKEMAQDLLAAALELGAPADRPRVAVLMRHLFEGEEAAPSAPPPVPEPSRSSEGLRLRAESIAEHDAVSLDPGIPLAPPVVSAPAEAAPPVSAAAGVHQPTEVVERARNRGRAAAELPKFPGRAAEPDATVRVPEATPSRPLVLPVLPDAAETPSVPEGEEATLAVTPGSPLEIDEGQTPSDASLVRPADQAATEAHVPLQPTANPASRRLSDPRRGRESRPDPAALRVTVDRLPTELDRAADDATLAVVDGPSSPAAVAPPRIPIVRAPKRSILRRHVAVAIGIFILGAMAGLWASLRGPPPPTVEQLREAVPSQEIAEAAGVAVAGADEAPIAAALDPSAAGTASVAGAAGLVAAGRAELPAPELVPVPPMATLDIVSPRNARVRLDGQVLKRRTPIRGLEVTPGKHEVTIIPKRGRQRVVAIELEPGEHADIDPAAPKRRAR